MMPIASMQCIYDPFAINKSTFSKKKETKNSILITAHELSPDLALKPKYKRIFPY